MKLSIFKKLLPIAGLLVSTNLMAYDFSSNGIYYEVIADADNAVAVVAGDEGVKYSGDIVIPGTVTHEGTTYTVTKIGGQAFSNCNGLNSVVIPNTVTIIGDWAFSYCYDLTTVDFPASITSFNAGCFWSCQKLESVTFGDAVTDIDVYSFGNCDALTTLNIPASATNVKPLAFGDSNNLSDIFVDDNNETYCDIDGVLYTKDEATILYCPAAKTSVTLSSKVNNIDEKAFFHAFSLENIMVDAANPNYTSIDGILYSKSGTDLLTCPSGRVNFGFAESAVRIGPYAFECCANLEEITIPDQIKLIDICAFNDCYNLKTVVIGDGVTTIADNAFDFCEALSSLTIGQSVKTIGNSAFSFCQSLTTLIIPDNVTTLGNFAFLECAKLSSIRFGKSLNLLNNNCFANCEEIATIYSDKNVPPIAAYGVFTETVLNNATLYIPKGAKAQYASMEPWNKFKNVQEIDFSGVEGVESDANFDVVVKGGKIEVSGADYNAVVEVYNIDGRLVAKGNAEQVSIDVPGAYIIRVGNFVKKVVL